MPQYADISVVPGCVMLGQPPSLTLTVEAARDWLDALRQAVARAEMASPGDAWHTRISLGEPH